MENIRFYGNNAREAEEFVAAVNRIALDEGTFKDTRRIASSASKRLRGAARRWFVSLDDVLKQDWIVLRRAILKRWTVENDSAIPAIPAAPPGLPFKRVAGEDSQPPSLLECTGCHAHILPVDQNFCRQRCSDVRPEVASALTDETRKTGFSEQKKRTPSMIATAGARRNELPTLHTNAYSERFQTPAAGPPTVTATSSSTSAIPTRPIRPLLALDRRSGSRRDRVTTRESGGIILNGLVLGSSISFDDPDDTFIDDAYMDDGDPDYGGYFDDAGHFDDGYFDDGDHGDFDDGGGGYFDGDFDDGDLFDGGFDDGDLFDGGDYDDGGYYDDAFIDDDF